MHHFLIAEPNETMLRMLTDALNCVDIGIILLNRDMRVRFINDRQIELFDLPPALLSTGPHFRDLVAFAAANGRIEMPSERKRRAHCRTGGRRAGWFNPADPAHARE